MTMRKIVSVISVVIFMTMALSACSRPARPPDNGIFVANNNLYVQLKQYGKLPLADEVNTIESATQNPLEITVDIPELTADDIQVISINGESQEFSVIYTGSNSKWFRIRLKVQPEKGIYCVTQIAKEATLQSYWCFQVP